MINMKQNLDGNESGIIETDKNVEKIECDDILKLKRKEYNKKYRSQHRETAIQYSRNYYKNNKSKLLEYTKEYRNKNKSLLRVKRKEYYLENKKRIRLKNIKNRDYRNEYSKVYYRKNKSSLIRKTCVRFRLRYKNDILFKIKVSLRNRVCDAFKYKNLIKSKKTKNLLGCSWEELKTHMETQFKPGMTWDNHKKDGWHIDHIVPLGNAKNEEEMERLCHYTNLQPLWWYENLSKGNKQ